MNKLFIKNAFLKFTEVLCYSSDPKIFYLGLVGSLYFMYVGKKENVNRKAKQCTDGQEKEWLKWLYIDSAFCTDLNDNQSPKF